MFKTKLTLALAVLLAFSLFFAALLSWSNSRSGYYLERSQQAQEEVQSYLGLAADTYRLFKQYRRSLQTDSPGLMTEELVELQQQLKAKVDRLHDQILAEIDAVDTSTERAAEGEEMAHLHQLTEEINRALGEVERAQQLYAEDRTQEATALLTRVLEDKVDGRITTLIDQAVTREETQLRQANRAANEVNARMATMAAVAAVLVSILALISTWLLRRSLTRPLRVLAAGTQRLAAGDLSHRIETGGRDEFEQLARSINAMAGKLESTQAALKERGAQLQRANDALQKTDDIRRQFFADVSHELRTPLTIIRGEGEVALDDENITKENYKASLTRMVDQAEHLGQLVDDLFLMARSGAGVVDLRSKDVALEALARQVCSDLATLAKPKGIEISFSSSAANQKILGDRRRLRQLLVILLDNAVRYSRQGDHIAVRLHGGAEGIEIAVADTGVGIAPEDQHRVFDRFFRGREGKRLSSEGSGLGMPLAKSIAEAHGGEISIDSTVGAGTTVTITLPQKVEDLGTHGSRTESEAAQ